MIMLKNIYFVRICLVVGYFLSATVEAEDATTAECNEPRCVGVDLSNPTRPTVEDTCGAPCLEACDGLNCLFTSVGGECGFGRACLSGPYHMVLTQGGDPCECSVIDRLTCFSSMATANVEKKGTTFIKDLEVGDMVLTGENEYKPVYTVDHKNPNKQAKFIQIYSTSNVETALELTESHMIFLAGKENPIPASAVKIGDALQTVNNGSPSIVTKISSVERKGIWNPITADGTIVVDNIVTSTYSVPFRVNDDARVEAAGVQMMSHHYFLHLLMAPYRAMCLGLSLSFCETKEEYNGYSQLGKYILMTSERQSEAVQDVMIFVALQVAFLFQLFSSAMGSPLVVSGLLLGTGAHVFNAKKKKFQTK